ncbi:MAG: peptide chain release factor N(5)-glutamine methyltransferase [Treponema sp.]|jgi:release factor glutamine methyltransferase|nr:peptide chain release factor N(5)-glutamine methyltransferase [Treponema sp.]
MTVGEALAEGTALLRTAGVETARLDASLLLAEILKTGRTGLIRAPEAPVSEESLGLFRQFLGLRQEGLCVAYILGRREFRGLDFTVSPAVLVPRPDTETLVEAALSRIDRLPSPALVLDLCTGSGAVAISLKHERPALSVYGSDISAAALRVARLNAERLLRNPAKPAPPPGTGPETVPPVVFIESDLFKNFGEGPGIPRAFDLITANPPYVPTGMIETLSREVRREPRISLDGGESGLVIVERLIREARDHIKPGGALLIEAGPGQMARISGILADQGYKGIMRYQDLSGRERVIEGLIPVR